MPTMLMCGKTSLSDMEVISPFPFLPGFVSCTRGYEALCTWPLQAPRVLPGPSWLQAKAVALRVRTASPLPPSAPGPPSERANGWAGRGAAHGHAPRAGQKPISGPTISVSVYPYPPSVVQDIFYHLAC